MSTMSEEAQATSSPGIDLTALRHLSGPAPVLSSESAQSYDEMTVRLMECFTPKDFMELMLIKELIDCTWEMMRYSRHKTLATERRFQQRVAFQVQRRKAAMQRAETQKDPTAKSEQKPEPATEPQEVLDSLMEEIDAILLKPATELAHAHALEVALTYIERLDKLHIMATGRRNNVLDQIERYRTGLSFRLRAASDKIIDGQAVAIQAPSEQGAMPLVPSGEQPQQ
jgi:hypothetical protein